MMYSITFHPKAEKEFLHSYDYYEEQSLGLGKRFEQIVDDQINLIKNNPLLFPEKKNHYRECPGNYFSFCDRL